MKKTFLVFAIFSCSIFFGACSEDNTDDPTTEQMEEEEEEEQEEEEEEEEEEDPTTAPLAGKIGGEEWTYKVGKITQELDGTLIFELYGQDADDDVDYCEVFLTSKARIKFFIPSEEIGVYDQPREISTQSVRFFPSESNGGATQTAVSGYVELTSVDGDEIVGKMEATADDDHFAIGTFTVTKCY